MCGNYLDWLNSEKINVCADSVGAHQCTHSKLPMRKRLRDWLKREKRECILHDKKLPEVTITPAMRVVAECMLEHGTILNYCTCDWLRQACASRTPSTKPMLHEAEKNFWHHKKSRPRAAFFYASVATSSSSFTMTSVALSISCKLTNS